MCWHWLKGHVRAMSSSPSSSSSDDEAAPEPARPDWQTEEDGSARRMVFLVTFAGVLAETAPEAEPPLRTLDGLTRADIQAAIADAVANPQAESRGRPRVASLQVQRMVVALEQPLHFCFKAKHFGPLSPGEGCLEGSCWLSFPLEYQSHTMVERCAAVVDPEPLVWLLSMACCLMEIPEWICIKRHRSHGMHTLQGSAERWQKWAVLARLPRIRRPKSVSSPSWTSPLWS